MSRATILITLCATLAFAQGSTTGEIRGVVRDPSGAIVPGASVKAKDAATGVEKTAASSADGVFVLLSLQPGSYQLTVTAQGFQTAKYDGINVLTGRVIDVAVEVKVGTLSETVEVTGAATALETTSNQVSTTVTTTYIQELPFSGRDVLNFALLMPGSQSIDTGRTSTFNGLPNASLNISVDGVNNNSQRFKTGGTSFFEFAPSRLDAVDEITVTTAGSGADAGGEGSMQVQFTTKRGTDVYHGKIFEQFQNEDLNANRYFSNLRGLPIAKVRNNNFGGNFGGKLVPFIPYLRNRLFFFVNFEALPQPGSTSQSTTILTPDAQAGKFTYIRTDGQSQTVNLLQAASAAGLPNAIDPTVAGILSQVNSSQSSASNFLPISGKPFSQTMFWNQTTKTLTLYPTARVDYQISDKITWHASWNLRYQNITGSQPPYPGSPNTWPNGYKITTYTAANNLDWAITPHMMNNFTVGVQSNGEYFYQGSDPHQWAPQGNRVVVLPQFNGTTLANPIPGAGFTPFIRNNPVIPDLTDNLNWVRGRHRFTIGGKILHTSFYETSYGSAGVPTFNLGLAAGDPAATAIQNALPAISTSNGDLTNAQNLYALLTGRLSSVSVSTNINENTKKYSQYDPVTQRFAFTTGALYFQDSFRWSPQLTLNYGLRWEFDGAIHNTNGIDTQPDPASFFGPSTGPFQPGSLGGNQNPAFVVTTDPYRRDFRNASPNFGFAFNPDRHDGFLGRLLGGKRTVIRGSYSIQHYNEGLNAISNLLSNNPGTTQSGTLQASSAAGASTFAYGLGLATPGVPAITSTPAAFTSSFPQSLSTFSSGLSYINPELRSPYVQNWSFGIQRELGKNFVVEGRYIGNKATHLWHTYNMQETNIFENGFLQQFVQAQANLAINIANGRGNSFANNGLVGQAALPIFDAAFGARGSQAALAASSGYGNSTYVTNLQQGVAGTLASSLAGTISTYCRMVGNNFGPCATNGYNAPGPFPINFFRPNPFVTGLTYQDDNDNSNYNGMQLEIRKLIPTWGLTFRVNYTWSHTLSNLYNSGGQTGTTQVHTLRNQHLDYGPTPFDIRQSFQTYFTYDLPVGRNRLLNVQNRLLDRIVGGWSVGGLYRITSGLVQQVNGGRNTVNVNNTSTTTGTQSGVVLGQGVTISQLQHDLNTTVSANAAGNLVSAAKIGSNFQADLSYLAPASTPGVFNNFLYVYGPRTFVMDMSLNKEVPIRGERWKFGFQLLALNFLNHAVFPMATTNPTSSTFGQITNTFNSPRNVQLRAYMSF